MAAKKFAQVDTRSSSLKKALAFLSAATPIVIRVVQTMRDNPEISHFVKEQLAKLRRNDKATPEAMLATLEALREQVTLLTESADDGQEAAQAAAWSAKLDSATRAAKLLAAPGSTASQRRTLKKQIDSLRQDIFAAYVAELGEDASAGRK
ncbi:hypothetical protein HMPREF3159_12680 [Brachybacterium sp. HMSC06H03]|uniref:hypothetical protein n=1 Tax=Brachybacterium sp. HMSC06H03 TaxID=1581127 RepID=UPI0008A3F9BD|nr:hypothetical protein [Brachybacterium sp. HMSC06H03]OFT49237.1 hypothetical protein HMPREF3159_12680 [Brachybacterium sp. HMSC06H03]